MDTETTIVSLLKIDTNHNNNRILQPITESKYEHMLNSLQKPRKARRVPKPHWEASVDALLQQAIETIDNYMQQEKATQQDKAKVTKSRKVTKRRNKRTKDSSKDWRGCTLVEQQQFKRVSVRSWRHINCLLNQTQDVIKRFKTSHKTQKRGI